MPDAMKPSRLLLRLEAEIAAAATPLEADCKRAERAAYLARVGRFAEVRSELNGLHGRNNRNPKIRTSIWINLAEGLLSYFGNVGASGTDRVHRAYALSVAAGVQPMRAICAAWLAQLNYVDLNMDSLSHYVSEALQLASLENHAARARANLVAAQALHLAGRHDLAQVWYRRCRDHAVAEGDDVTISALMHNMAWLRMLLMRQAALTGVGTVGDGRYALVNAESTDLFDEIVGDASWQQLRPILRAQIVSLQGDAAQAITLYDEYLNSGTAPFRLQANLLADKAWCHAQLHQLDEARVCSEAAIASLSSETQIDDKAAAHSRLAKVFFALKDTRNGQGHELLSHQAWAAHKSIQERAISLLKDISEHGVRAKSP